MATGKRVSRKVKSVRVMVGKMWISNLTEKELSLSLDPNRAQHFKDYLHDFEIKHLLKNFDIAHFQIIKNVSYE